MNLRDHTCSIIFTILKLWLHRVLCLIFKMSSLLLSGVYAPRQIFKCRAVEKQQNASTPNNHKGHGCGRGNMVFSAWPGQEGGHCRYNRISSGVLKLLRTGLLDCLLLASFYFSQVLFSSCILLLFTNITSYWILV